MILAVDAGNSRIKWALHDGSAFSQEGRAAHAQFESLAQAWLHLPVPSRIVVANVAGDTARSGLQRLFARWPVEVQWVSAMRSQCGVTSRYDDPAQLGPDRWAALVGARRIEKRACLVVNAGTAMTVDALTATGEFPGGIIVPGFDLMHESLAVNTARLTSGRGRFAAFPRATADAITTGAVNALCGAIDRMAAQMSGAGHGEPVLLVGGGTADIVAEHLDRPSQIVERLVLEGLVCIAREPR